MIRMWGQPSRARDLVGALLLLAVALLYTAGITHGSEHEESADAGTVETEMVVEAFAPPPAAQTPECRI